MKNRRLILVVVFTVFTIFTSLIIFNKCSVGSYINKSDSIADSDEKLIKEFRSSDNYSNEELKSLDIKYLGEVDGYKIYFVPFKDPSGVLNDSNWTKEKYTFPFESHARIIGIKDNKLFTLSNLIFETSINIEGLYNLLPSEYK